MTPSAASWLAALVGVALAITLTGVGDWESFVTALIFAVIAATVAAIADGRLDVIGAIERRRSGMPR
jgi:hypothetical protein